MLLATDSTEDTMRIISGNLSPRAWSHRRTRTKEVTSVSSHRSQNRNFEVKGVLQIQTASIELSSRRWCISTLSSIEPRQRAES
eukprot:gene3490-biopygen12063